MGSAARPACCVTAYLTGCSPHLCLHIPEVLVLSHVRLDLPVDTVGANTLLVPFCLRSGEGALRLHRPHSKYLFLTRRPRVDGLPFGRTFLRSAFSPA